MQMKMNRRLIQISKRWISLVLGCFILAAAGQVQAQQSANTFILVGTANIQKGNVTDARQQAISNSLVAAVGLSAADMLSVEAMVVHNDRLNEMLYSKTGKYIQDYKVLAEAAFEDIYRVVVQVTVSSNRIKNQLTTAGVIRVQKTMPRVLFLISEQDLENPMPQYWWGRGMSFIKPTSEMAIADAMREQGFRVIEHGPRVQEMANKGLRDVPELSKEEAVNFGNALNADVVVVGTAAADETSNVMGSGVRSFKGMIDVRAYRTKTGREIAALSKSVVTANVDDIAGSRDALRGAGSATGEQLSQIIADAWQREALEADKIEIQLTGTKNLANFVMFRRMLNTISGVEGVQVKELQTDNAVLNVDFKGKPKELADALMVNAFETFGINIYEISQTGLKIQLISNSPSAARQ
jgi:hypothetical protein